MYKFNLYCAINLILFAGVLARDCNINKSNSKLVCYYSDVKDANSCKCSHVILPQVTDAKDVERVREKLNGVKILITVNNFNENLTNLLKHTKVDGLEVHLKKLDSKSDIGDFISTIKTKLGGDLYVALSVPPKAEALAKYFDFKALSKYVDLFVLQTAFLGASENVTFHPSRLSGLWDMQNTDSVVDLISGLGAPLSKVIITAPVQAFQFTLQNESYTAPGSPALELRSITRDHLCNMMGSEKKWMLERDQDQAGPYIFSNKHWIAFDDHKSIDIKAKYARVRGLAGLALKDVSQDGQGKCGGPLLEAAYNGLLKQARAPRGAVLHSLERGILETPARPLDTIQVSPYRISRVIDVEGNVHVIRKDTRTEFECARQGYYVHPRSCGRFYRCVKFDQLSDEFNVFEFDCPSGLAFDDRVEVCVWPGSLARGSPCSGSSEIAPVPRQRFICPGEPGYYPDPENCRWFFACLDHGKSPLSAYEFRCPFGLVFDETRLLCEWPWLVPRCASGEAGGVLLGQTQEFVYGKGNGASLGAYDGLGLLGPVQLGGLNGPFAQAPARIYTSGHGQLAGEGQRFGQIGNNQGGVVYTDAKIQGELVPGSEIYAGGVEGVSVNNGAFDGQNIQSNVQFGAKINEFDSFNNQPNVELERANLAAAIARAQENAHIINQGLSSFGSKSSGLDTSSEYKTNIGAARLTPIVGNVNIVGGGYSAVGVAAGAIRSEIEITHDGSNIDSNVSPYPILLGSSTPSSIPVVSSVPLPASASEQLENFSGGVVANIPQLQFKIESPSKIFYESNIASTAANETFFVNYVSSTPVPIVSVSEKQNFDIPKVSIVSTTPSYDKFEVVTPSPVPQEPVKIAVQQPVLQQAYQPVQPAVVSNYQYQSQDEFSKNSVSGYGYAGAYQANLPIAPVSVIQQGIVLNDLNEQKYASYANSGYGFAKSSVAYSGKPVAQVQYANIANKQKLQPAVATNFKNLDYSAKFADVGYAYPVPVQPVVFNAGFPAGLSTFSYQNSAKSNAAAAAAVVQSQYNNLGSYVNYTVPVVSSTPKSTIVFGAKQVQPTFVSSTPRPLVSVQSVTFLPVVSQPREFTPVQVTTAQQYINQNQVSSKNIAQSEGYVYSKPAIRFEEGPGYIYSTPAPLPKLEPAPAPKVEGYVYSKPSIQFEEVHLPKVVPQPVAVPLSKPVPTAKFEGYVYSQPSIKFEEGPAYTYSTPAPSPKPAPTAKFQGYVYSQPSVKFEESPIYTYSTPAPLPKPVPTPLPKQKFEGYVYSQPSIKFEEVPTYTYSTPAPLPQPVPTQPAIQQVLVEQKKPAPVFQSSGYDYPKPAIPFEIPSAPAIQPVQVSTYAPPVVSKKVEVSTPVVVSTYAPPTIKVTVTRPNIVTKPKEYAVPTYTYQQPAVEFKGYNYPKPSVSFSEQPIVAVDYGNREPVYEEPFVAKKAYVTTGNSYHNNYQQQQVNLQTNYRLPAPEIKYVQPVQPTYVAPQQYSQSVDVSRAYYINHNANASILSSYKPTYYSTPTPEVLYSTPQPAVYYTTQKTNTYSVPKQKVIYSPKPTVYYSTPQPTVYYSSPKPTTYYSTPKQTVYYSTPKPTVYYSTPKPTVYYSTESVPSTPKPTFQSVVFNAANQYNNQAQSYNSASNVKFVENTYSTTPLPPSTQSPPISRYSFSSLDSNYQTYSIPKITTYAPVVKLQTYSTPDTSYLPVVTKTTTYAPVSTKTKYVESYVAPEVKVSTPPNTYLPVEEVSTRRPAKIVKVVRPKVTTLVKENDFHPLLSAKLGAQCTCVSNTVKLNKRPQQVPQSTKGDYEYRPTEAIQAQDFEDNSGSVVVESYQYEPKKLSGYTPSPEVVIKSTTNQISPAPAPTYARKRVRVRPVTTASYVEEPVTQAIEVFVPKSASVKTVDEYSDKEIADTVRKGLSLVKAAAKDGAKEAIVESRSFDRYGPGGWRSRDETLQGTVDCQRAGLFRHPTECNKFYACRWDCTKNRYTLHVFNCPVHLTFDNNLGACNWPSQGPACLENTLLPNE